MHLCACVSVCGCRTSACVVTWPCGCACRCASSWVCVHVRLWHMPTCSFVSLGSCIRVQLCPVLTCGCVTCRCGCVSVCGGGVRVCIYKWVCHTSISDGASARACVFTCNCAECARLRAVVHPHARVARLCVAVHLRAVVARPRAIPPLLVSSISVQLCIRVWQLCAHVQSRVQLHVRVQMSCCA